MTASTTLFGKMIKPDDRKLFGRRQPGIGENIYGKSITDACLGWEDTAKLIDYIAENV
jgi:3-deoxy-7-phosphoheptulonate synthase